MTTMNDYRILQAVLDENDDTKGMGILNGTTRLEIQAKTNMSLSKIAQSLNAFIEEGLVQEGIGEGRTKKYILTTEGVKTLLELQDEIPDSKPQTDK